MLPPLAPGHAWGFWAHRLINRLAVFTLPPELMHFYKEHIDYLTSHAVDPDRRRYAVEGEAPRHYIDIDVYGDSAIFTMPRRWQDAVAKYSEDTLLAYGIVPWHVDRMRYRLTEALRRRDARDILRQTADLGHYVADANVPLHTTENYNGQLTGQRGIHGFWESRLPELFAPDYDLFVGPPEYLFRPLDAVWDHVTRAHLALDSVLGFERELTKQFPDDRKYGFEERGTATVRVYSREFSEAYHDRLGGQVERQMRASVKLLSDLIYTCWIDAGQPDLRDLDAPPLEEPEPGIEAGEHPEREG
ncbi:MAG: zinc dependent phospholipase C family protein [Catalinimonas sp.]